MTALAATSPVLVFVHLLAACVWIGGFVALVLVTRVARARLDPQARVAFFRALGRAYGIVGASALVVALASGAVLLTGHPWDGVALAAVLLGAVLLATTAAGIVQARAMTRLRRAAEQRRDDPALAERVRRGARGAAALRASIGALTLALLALGAALAT